jgi:ketosteroid isomerase-like protein
LSSQRRVEAVRRLFELWGEGAEDVPTDLVAPEIELVSPLTSLRGRPYRGYDEARQWVFDIREQFESWDYTLDEVRSVGDKVLALGKVRLEGRASGVSLDQEAAWLASFADDGRIVRMEIFTDRDAALEAAGGA